MSHKRQPFDRLPAMMTHPLSSAFLQSRVILLLCPDTNESLFKFGFYKDIDLINICFHWINLTYPKSPCDSSELIKKQGVDRIPDLAHVMCVLATESIPNLPPGGELASK